ncbi:GerAB/ArcD/ProY family transporter [Hathewaya limosa]|uniref:Spore germination protein (Amino acid permease) n=1 Tax=Hathewaya limosa TaxID=1536 RepID=A0ABU0JSB0_HATLI|nr:GerAB/ArcD/ProY family transporter [Hathewaya limosa]MDQ0479988.1 spore germination protein (amino acid permease) [Hathewaya limosa]
MKEYLTDFQICFLVFCMTIGYEVITLPKDLVEYMGTSAWIGIIILTILMGIFAFFVIKLNTVFLEKNFCEYITILTGKKWTKIIEIIYFGLFLVIYVNIPKFYSNTLKLIVYPRTPIWVLELALYLLCYYGICKGLKGIARICEIYGVLQIILMTLILSTTLLEGDPINLFPLFNFYNPKEFFKGMIYNLISFVGIEAICLTTFSKKNKKSCKYTLIIIGIIGLMYILTVQTCLAVLGQEEVIKYSNVVLTTLRTISITMLDIITRLDGIFIIIWNIGVVSGELIVAYGTVHFLYYILNKKIAKNKLGLIITIGCFIYSFFSNFLIEQKIIVMYTIFVFSIFTTALIPTILFILMKVKGYDKKS